MSFFDRYIAHGFRTSSVTHMSAEQLANNRELLYDSFAFNNWNNLGFQDKVKCLQALENDFAGQQGRPALPVRTTSEDCYGYYSPSDNAIYVNENYIDHGNFDSVADAIHPSRPDANIQLFDTIAHEGYHGYQNYAMKHPEVHSDKHQLSEWAMNEGKYYGGRNSGDKYYLQPQERDAWAYGYEKTTEAFEGIEARNGNEPGMHDYEKMASLSSYDEAKIRAESVDPDVLSNMESEMKTTCESKGIDYDYEDPNVTPTMVEDKVNYGFANDNYTENRDIDEDKQNQNQRDKGSEESFEESLADENTEQEKSNSELNEDADEIPSEKNAEQEEQASDLMEGADEAPTEENTEQEEQASDLTEGADESRAEDNTEQEEQASDLMEGADELPAEDNTEQEEQASDLTESADESLAEDNTEQEEQASDLTEGADEAPTEENTEQEEQASDLSGMESTNDSESEGESSEEEQSYGY